jgi:predicted transcriptional regulator
MSNVPTVNDFMDKSFITLHPEMDVYKAIDILLSNRITGAAVVDDREKLVGVLSEKDCLQTLVHGVYSGLPGAKVSDYMTSEVVTIGPELDVFSTADLFLKNTFRRLLVVKDDKLVGQITRRDLLRAIQKIKAGQ